MTTPRKRTDRDRVSFRPIGETMAKQSHKAECDINTILAKYIKTGVLSHVRAGGTYEDMPGPMEFQDAMNLVIEAERMFLEMPAKLRSRFQNDPKELLQFCSDPANKDEAIALGLIPAPKPPMPAPDPEPPLPLAEGDD